MEEKNETRKEYLQSLKELKVGVGSSALFIFTSCLISYFVGYRKPAEEIKFILGIPDWVFWGVLIPWIAIVLFTVWYGLFKMKGDEKI